MDCTSVESDSIDMGQLERTCLKGLRIVEEVVESWRKRKVVTGERGLRWSLCPPGHQLSVDVNLFELASKLAMFNGLQFELWGKPSPLQRTWRAGSMR